MTKFVTVILGFSFVWIGMARGIPLRTSEVPPPAPQLGQLPEVQKALRRSPEQKIVPYIPQTAKVISTRFSQGAEGSRVVSKPVDQSKLICFHVNEMIQGQVGTMMSLLSPDSKISSFQRDVESSSEQAKTIFVNSLKSMKSNSAKSTSGTRYVISFPQMNVNRNACVEVPFKEGVVEIFWLSVGRPNPKAVASQPQKGGDGVMQLKVVPHRQFYIIDDPDLAEVIHSAVIDLTPASIVILNDPELE